MENLHYGSGNLHPAPMGKEEDLSELPFGSFKYEQIIEEKAKSDQAVFRVVTTFMRWMVILFVLKTGEPDLIDVTIKLISQLGGE